MSLLSFPIEAQHATEWCWLTAAVCTDHYYNPASTWTQETLANQLLALTVCNTLPLPQQCNVPGQLAQSLGYVQRLRTSAPTPILFSGVQLEIDASDPVGHPICAGITWVNSEIGHAVVICGFDSSAGTDYIYVADPATGSTNHIPFDTFLTSYLGKGTWTDTYFTEP